MPDQKNPTQLKSAVLFAAMYALVLFALAWAKEPWTKEHMGEKAMYGVACLSGLTDMDAITLSTARMSRTDAWVAAEGWRLILIAALSNLVFKAVLVGLLGTRRLLGEIALLYAIPLLGGIALIFGWEWVLLGQVAHG